MEFVVPSCQPYVISLVCFTYGLCSYVEPSEPNDDHPIFDPFILRMSYGVDLLAVLYFF